MRKARLAALGGPVCRAPTGRTGGGRRSKIRLVEEAPVSIRLVEGRILLRQQVVAAVPVPRSWNPAPADSPDPFPGCRPDAELMPDLMPDLSSTPATELARRIAAREISAVEVMKAHLARIREVNPRLNAIVTLLPEDTLLREAEAADAKVATGDALGPLHGLPVAHKDLTLTRGIRTTFGSPIFADFVPEEDALIVERLRAAGAITIGKTNTPEFGAGSQTFNPVFGPTRNPWDETKTCGGSSGGAAVALATGMVPIADGSDYGGSLRNPASFCGVVGLRPSPGRVPVWPNETPWFPIPVQGPMARSAADAALMLSAIAGPDPRAPLSLPEPGDVFRSPLDRDFRGTRVAWSADFGGIPFDPRIPAALAPARGALEAVGCAVEDAAPDMSGAAVAFDRWRGLVLRTQLGPAARPPPGGHERHGHLEHRAGQGPHRSGARRGHPPLDGAPPSPPRVPHPLRILRSARLPGAAVRPHAAVSHGSRRGPDEDLHRLDGVLFVGVASRLAGDLGSGGPHPGRTPRRPPDRRPRPRRLRRPPTRARPGA